MREITCDEREAEWAPKMLDGTILVGSSSTNFMGNGIVETTWFWADTSEPAFSERVQYEAHGWPDPKRVELCQHWVHEAGDPAP